jgi:hypothetical protein
LKQSLSTGNLGLIKLTRERLPGEEFRDRLDLPEVAAAFHPDEVFMWLLRDATVGEREDLWVFALEHKPAAALQMAHDDVFGPWWYGVREVSRKWRASAKMEFVSAPEGFSAEGGWLTSNSGGECALPPLGS